MLGVTPCNHEKNKSHLHHFDRYVKQDSGRKREKITLAEWDSNNNSIRFPEGMLAQEMKQRVVRDFAMRRLYRQSPLTQPPPDRIFATKFPLETQSATRFSRRHTSTAVCCPLTGVPFPPVTSRPPASPLPVSRRVSPRSLSLSVRRESKRGYSCVAENWRMVNNAIINNFHGVLVQKKRILISAENFHWM